MTETATQSFLTQEAFDRLSAELAHLSGEGRTEIAKRIEAAREEGDLKENGGYHAAKEEQGKMEARIRQLTQLLENAKVGETPKDNGVVEPGMIVTVEMFGDEETFLLGHREIKDDSGLEVFSEQSPLGTGDQRQEGRLLRHVLDPVRQDRRGQGPQGRALHRLDRSAQQRRVAVRPQGPEHLFTVFGAFRLDVDDDLDLVDRERRLVPVVARPR